MAKFILGKKIGMTQVFDSEGNASPATVLSVGPAVVTQIKTREKDGYFAIQIGFDEGKAKNIKKPQKGHLKKLGDFRVLREFRVSEDKLSEFKIGDKIDASIFANDDVISIVAVSKGKGFQGVVKRHGFAGGPRTHGQKHSEREPGSIGIGGVQRVLKGKKMAGRMGSQRTTIKNLKVIKVLPDSGQIIIKGGVPGRKGTLVELSS